MKLLNNKFFKRLLIILLVKIVTKTLLSKPKQTFINL